MEKEAVPFTALTENFSSIPLMAPPPFGKDMEGISIALDLVFPLSVLRNWEDELWFSVSLFILLPVHFDWGNRKIAIEDFAILQTGDLPTILRCRNIILLDVVPSFS